MKPRIKKALACLLVLALIASQEAVIYAQAEESAVPEIAVQKPQPPMENVFFNVLWGSLTGGMLMMGWSTLDDSKPEDERFGTSNLSMQFLAGATSGGLLGLIAGVYISMKGITFDESRSKIAFFQLPQQETIPSGKYEWSKKEINKQPLNIVNFQMKF
jgi:hypothetical protein